MSEQEPNLNKSPRPGRLTRSQLIEGAVAFSGLGSPVTPEEGEAEIQAMAAARESLRGKPPIHPEGHEALVREVQDAIDQLHNPNNPQGLYTKDDVIEPQTPPQSQS